MSMNKKELAQMDELRRELRIARAWKLTEPVETDLQPPNFGGPLVKGFLFNSYSMQVEKACTDYVHHSWGRDDKTDSQGTYSLFSTPLLALRAMRYQIERECIAKLAQVDEMIEAAIQKAQS